MPVTSSPKFPIVDPSPKLDKTLANLSLIDYTKIGAFGTVGYVFGWFSGKAIMLPEERLCNKSYSSFSFDFSICSSQAIPRPAIQVPGWSWPLGRLHICHLEQCTAVYGFGSERLRGSEIRYYERGGSRT